MDIRANEPGAAFSYDVDERWSGPGGLARVVTVMATPGVAVDERPPLMAALPVEAPGRRLVPRIIRVNTAREVPGHDGTGRSSKRIRAGEYVRSERHLGTNPQDATSSLLETRGGQGVTVRESKTGARMEIRPKDARIGGAYAYEIVRAAEGGTAEIRALVGRA